jgi:WhiB family redox-sensing transcriptional regulator
MRSEVLSHRIGAGGLCSDSNDDRWYPDGSSFGSKTGYIEYARAACLGCAVRNECLELALRIEARAPGGPHGVWGGTTPQERREMIAHRRREEVRRG